MFVFDLGLGQTLGSVLDDIEYEIPDYFSTSEKYWGISSIDCDDDSSFDSLDELKKHVFYSDSACKLYFAPDRLSPGYSTEQINQSDGKGDFSYALVSYYNFDGSLVKIENIRSYHAPCRGNT